MADISELEVAWLAGLLEGEGCFYFGDRGRILIRLAMTDLDVVERAATLMGATMEKPVQPSEWRRKAIFPMRVRGTLAIEWMDRLLPYMGTRRQAKIRECLAYAAARPGKRWNSQGGVNKPWRGRSDRQLALKVV